MSTVGVNVGAAMAEESMLTRQKVYARTKPDRAAWATYFQDPILPRKFWMVRDKAHDAYAQSVSAQQAEFDTEH